MRIIVTGASGFVGSAIAAVCRDVHGDEVITERVDLLDPNAIAEHVAAVRPDGVIHSAIINDWDTLVADRHAAWAAFVTSTRAYAEAADAVGAPFVLVSTDWVFDGTQAPAAEDTPPNPVNLYGFLKAASELSALERGGAVARVSGVNGIHRGGRELPRVQDHGFGYLVDALVESVTAGEPFTVWDAPTGVNQRASPSLATMCGEVMRGVIAAGDEGAGRIVHCCGADAVTRRQLAALVADIFELDTDLIDHAPPPAPAPMPIPADTALDATATARFLGYDLPPVETLLEAVVRERADGTITPFLGSS